MKVLVHRPKTVDGLIFHGPLGGKMQDSTVLRNLKVNVIANLKSKYPTPPGELGFEHGKVHSLRHYCCSASFRNGATGATEPQLLQWLGHKDSKMVAHYRHLRPDDYFHPRSFTACNRSEGWLVGEARPSDRYFLGGHDLEMVTIGELLAIHGADFRDTGLRWGARVSAYGERDFGMRGETSYVAHC